MYDREELPDKVSNRMGNTSGQSLRRLAMKWAAEQSEECS